MTWLPTSTRFSKKAQLMVGIPAAAFNPASLVIGAARNAIAISEAGFRLAPEFRNRRFQLIRNAFIGIQTEDPVVGSLVNGKLLLQGEARPIPGYYSSSAGFGYLTCLVCGAGIYD